MRVAVVGTGYAGLVTGVCLAEAGHEVVCMDIDAAKIAKLQSGEMPIYEPGLAELAHKNMQAERLSFTTKMSELGDPAIIFFALPTPRGGDGQADLSYVLSAAGEVAKILKNYTVLVNKSTVPVGTAQKVRETVAKLSDVPFDVVSNPEFLREGVAINDFMNADRIVVGTSSDKALAVMQKLYQPFTAAGVPLLVMDEASAELTKYAANSFLVTKISYINEIANLCELVGANVDDVRRGLGADERIGSRFLFAGIGYGGSCFPKDILALHATAEANGYDFKLLDAAMQVNLLQKQRLVAKIVDHYGGKLKGKTFAIWGLSFKPDTDDVREAPGLDVIRALLDGGAKLQAYDPEAMANARALLPQTGISYVHDALDALDGANALVVLTEWKEFSSVQPSIFAKKLSDRLVFDGRNIFELGAMANAGLTYYSIGRATVNKNRIS